MFRTRFIPVGARIAVWTALVIGLVSAGAYFGISAFQWNTMLKGRGDSANDVASLFSTLVATSLIFDDNKGVEDSVKYLEKNPDLLAARVDTVSGGALKLVHQFVRPGATSEPTAEQIGTFFFDDRVVVREAVKTDEGKTIGRATLSFSLAQEQRAFELLRRQILFGSVGVALVMIAVLVYVVRRRVGRPLARLTLAAERLEQGEVISLSDDRSDEVGLLNGAFGRMAAALREREKTIVGRNRDMKLVLDNVEQGFIVVDRQACPVGERSAVADRWFGVPTPGQKLTHWLTDDPSFRSTFDLSWAQLIDDILPREVSVSQMPAMLRRGSMTWSLGYQLISAENGELAQVMVVLSDITAQLEREASELAQREMVEIVQRLGRDRSGFLEFVSEGARIVELLGTLEETSEQMRVVHTLKGTSSVCGITSVARVCHAIESRMVEQSSLIQAHELQSIRAAWSHFDAQVQQLSGGNRDVIEIEGALYRDFEARLAKRQSHAELQSALARWTLEPVRKRLDRLAEQAQSLGRRLGRGDIDVEIATDDCRLPAQAFAPFWGALVHVIRNAVDHGLEPLDERKEKGRPHVRLSAELKSACLWVSIEDDGRGIDWATLAKKAAAKGLPVARQEDLIEALFADGVSARDAVTETSGRGVGMSAVRNQVVRLGGSIQVESHHGKGTRFSFIIPTGAVDERTAA